MKEHESIFKPIFGEGWNKLPPVMHKHYANRPYSTDFSIVEGKMDIMCKWYLKPFFWFLGTVPPYNKKNVDVTLKFNSQPDNAAFCFDRAFHFKGRKPFHFRSFMTQMKENEVMERMNYGICWHSYYSWDGAKVTMRHKGYSWRVGGINIPLPITWLIGRGDADEWPIDDNTFDMCATIIHPLLGKVYEYKGQFKMVKEAW